MPHRPWPIVILALLHAIAPLPNILLSSFLQGVSPVVYLNNFGSSAELLGYLFFFPIAGLAIFATKKWSFPVFLMVMAWGFNTSYQSWLASPEKFPLSVLVCAFAVNLSVVAYFLMPAVKRVYFDSTVRWWERLPRYKVGFEAEVSGKWGRSKCLILDFSEGGAFVRVPGRKLRKGLTATLHFFAFGMQMNLECRIIHNGSQSRPGFGLRFQELSKEEQRSVRKFIKALELMGRETTQQRVPFPAGFSEWSHQLVSTGRGLIPEFYESSEVPPNSKRSLRLVRSEKKGTKKSVRTTGKKRKPRKAA